MDVETAIRAFASAGLELPREAMRWALDNWDEAAPGILGVLERFADGTGRSEEAANAAFFILHLAGERRETRSRRCATWRRMPRRSRRYWATASPPRSRGS